MLSERWMCRCLPSECRALSQPQTKNKRSAEWIVGKRPGHVQRPGNPFHDAPQFSFLWRSSRSITRGFACLLNLWIVSLSAPIVNDCQSAKLANIGRRLYSPVVFCHPFPNAFRYIPRYSFSEMLIHLLTSKGSQLVITFAMLFWHERM